MTTYQIKLECDQCDGQGDYVIKNEYDLKGNRESVYRQFNALCVDKGLENRPRPGSPLADNEYTGVDVFGEGASDEDE